MLCKDKITSIFCIIDDILKEINHSEDIPPLAQACSLSPIQNSEFKILTPTTTGAKIIFLVILSRYCTSTATENFSKYTYPIQTIQEHRRKVGELAQPSM